MKSFKYTVEMPNGYLETFRAPRFIDPKEIAEKLHNSVVYLHVEKGLVVYAIDYFGKAVEVVGPACVMIDNKEYYLVPRCPVDGNDSMAIWKQYRCSVAA